MTVSGELSMTSMIWIALGALAVPLVVVVIVSARPRAGETGAYRLATRARLPFGSAAGYERIRRRVQAEDRMTALAGVALIVALGIATPLAPQITPETGWIAVVVVLTGLGMASTAARLRWQLFAPRPRRVAHSRSLGLADYLPAWMRLPAPILLATGVLACVFEVIHWGPGSSIGILSLSLLAGATVIAVICSWLSRRVLDTPQPAADEIELAWNDLFRTHSLALLRMLMTISAWLALALPISASADMVWPGAPPTVTAALTMAPVIGVAVIQIATSLTQGWMRSERYPDSLRTATIHPESIVETNA